MSNQPGLFGQKALRLGISAAPSIKRSTGLLYEPRKSNTVVVFIVQTASPATVRLFRSDPPVDAAGVPGGFGEATLVWKRDARPKTFNLSLMFQSVRFV